MAVRLRSEQLPGLCLVNALDAPPTSSCRKLAICRRFSGGPDRDRTCDLGIKSPLLYQLSYRPAFRVYRRPPRIHWSRQGPHRLAVQVTALSRPQRGFESRWGHGRLAQLGEHLPYKQGVAGSSPAPPTSRKTRYGQVFWLWGPCADELRRRRGCKMAALRCWKVRAATGDLWAITEERRRAAHVGLRCVTSGRRRSHGVRSVR